MNCPFCGSDEVRIINSRLTKKSTETWRRRRCLSCKQVFTTYEKIDLSYLKVEKADGRKVYYNRAKLFSGIYNSAIGLKKVDRGDMGALAEVVTSKVEGELLQLRSRVVSTQQIFDISSRVLRKIHPGIYLHYLAYFRGHSKSLNSLLGYFQRFSLEK